MAKSFSEHGYEPLADLIEWREFLTSRIEELTDELMFADGATQSEGRGPTMGHKIGDDGRGDGKAARRIRSLLVEARALKAQNAKDLMPYAHPRLTASKVDANVDTTVRPGSGPISATTEFIEDALGSGPDAAPEELGER